MSAKQTERMSDFSFRMMAATMKIMDWVWPRVDRRVQKFGVRPGMTVVDYGCGPGRYTRRFSRLVGPAGKVYAVDVQPLALEMVKGDMGRYGMRNVVPVLAEGYNSGLPDECADMVFALDMFFGVSQPATFLKELKRITRKDGVLVIDDGHQSREKTLAKIRASGEWTIFEQSPDHLKCRKEN
ncbi:MAG: class I SAM-dependent methyltransferase [Anaerolineales bacterium]|jgi:ubiquinone/menaquinone biosynthesis C-methylase UbiE